MTGEAENRVQRGITEAFIAADADVVQVVRGVRTPDGAGGWKVMGREMGPPQTIRLIPRVNNSQSSFTQSTEGPQDKGNWDVMGMVDCVLARGDWFFVNGKKFVVDQVRFNEYQMKAVAHDG